MSEIETKLEEMFKSSQEEVQKNVSVKLEEQGTKIQDNMKVELETMVSEKMDALKKEVIELSKTSAPKQSVAPMTDKERVQLEKLNSCLKDGAEPISLETLREYNERLNAATKQSVNDGKINLEGMTIQGYAGFDDASGGALIIPEYDPEIQQDVEDYDMGLFNMINFAPAASRTKKINVDTLEPDADVKAVKESLKDTNYTLNEAGGFVQAVLNLKDYQVAAKITHDEIEDTAFRIEPYVNGKMAYGTMKKVAKDLWIGNSSESIKGLINYANGTGYGKIALAHVATAGELKMQDIINMCRGNHGKGVLVIDRATWIALISEKDNNGRYVFDLGFVGREENARPFHVDAYVPLVGTPVVFDDGLTLPEVAAKNIVAALVPANAIKGYKKPTGRFMVKNEPNYRALYLTERYDAVVSKFKYIKLLVSTVA